jgi:arsenate reductase
MMGDPSEGEKKQKRKILFVCTHNSSRSQMAEGLFRALRGDRYDAYSAGTAPTVVHPGAIAVMAEIGIDIRDHRAKGLDAFKGTAFDEIVTVCDNAQESCPVVPGGGVKRHQGFEDPSTAKGSEAEVLTAFRRVRDEIRNWIMETY